MFFRSKRSAVLAGLCSLLFLSPAVDSARDLPSRSRRPQGPKLERRQIPAEPTDVTTITSPSGATLRYKEPGNDGVCETTPGVKSYSGYVDLNETTHMFFWFFESRNNPSTDPLTLWLNGGPGSDSLIGLFQELGPCNVTEDLKTQVNPYAWNEVSNLLFLSQPVGVGFSYGTTLEGRINRTTGYPTNTSSLGANGRYSIVNETAIDTTQLAAVGTWEVLQGFLSNLPQLAPEVDIKKFNLWTESYGGHYGPVFFDYFQTQNDLIESGQANGTKLVMDTLGIGNGIISEKIQAPYYPRFAVNNTYGIKAINDTIADYALLSYYIGGGCSDSIDYCAESDLTTLDGYVACSQATAICRGLVEGPYYDYGGRGVYDIRHAYDDPTPPSYFTDFLNLASTQNSLGVDLNYTSDSSAFIFNGFSYTGDFVYPTMLEDLQDLLNKGVRVNLYHGDADYICNWFGGEAVSLEVNYTHSAEFRAAGYQPFMVNGVEYGQVRQYGNFSFMTVYEAGHEVPYYQPEASLALFNRTINNLTLADGSEALTPDYNTTGPATITHTESFVPLPTTSTVAASASPSASSTDKARLRY